LRTLLNRLEKDTDYGPCQIRKNMEINKTTEVANLVETKHKNYGDERVKMLASLQGVSGKTAMAIVDTIPEGKGLSYLICDEGKECLGSLKINNRKLSSKIVERIFTLLG